MKSFTFICSSYSHQLLDIYLLSLQKLLKLNNSKITHSFLPKKKNKITLLKSPHVFKKAKEQFEFNLYKVVINIELTPLQLKYVLQNKPKAISLKWKF